MVSGEQFESSMLEFVRVEVHTSITFASIALSSENDAEKRMRNRANARKGYDTAVHFLQESQKRFPEHEIGEELFRELKQLRTMLVELGEEFTEE